MRALEQARRCDRTPRSGPFHGLPVGVKDVLDTADMPTIWGDEATFGGRRPKRNAPVVQRLREEGAIVLGKTAISRFGFWFPGKARNPHNPEHTPGSSSSGSAAAVADFMCPLAIGTQTAGSIMRPAAFCGIVGMIPTHGWMPWRNSRNYAESFDIVGGLTRSVADMIFLMRGLTGKSDYDPDATLDGGLTVGLYRTTDWEKAPQYTRDSYEDTVKRVAEGGCVVRDVALPETYERLVETLETIGNYECARSFEWEMTHHRDLIDPGIAELLDAGMGGPARRVPCRPGPRRGLSSELRRRHRGRRSSDGAGRAGRGAQGDQHGPQPVHRDVDAAPWTQRLAAGRRRTDRPAAGRPVDRPTRRRRGAPAARTAHRGDFGAFHVIVNGVSAFDEETGEGGTIALARICRQGLGGTS